MVCTFFCTSGTPCTEKCVETADGKTGPAHTTKHIVFPRSPEITIETTSGEGDFANAAKHVGGTVESTIETTDGKIAHGESDFADATKDVVGTVAPLSPKSSIETTNEETSTPGQSGFTNATKTENATSCVQKHTC